MKTLVFVYNADSGLFNALSDTAHKWLSPDTYDCHLCAITYGMFSMQKEWKHFLQELAIPMDFLHRNELRQQYGINDHALPAVFIKENDELRCVLSADEINRCEDIAALKELIQQVL